MGVAVNAHPRPYRRPRPSQSFRACHPAGVGCANFRFGRWGGMSLRAPSLGVQCSSCWGRRSIDPSHTHHCAGCGCHGHGVFDVAVRMKQRRGLLTEPSPQQSRSSLRQCDPGLRHSLTEEHGPVKDSLTVAPRSSLHESAGFWSLVAERPPKVAVGFHPRSAITPNDLVAERRWNHRHTISRQREVSRHVASAACRIA